jgi:UPF0755 protein
MKILIRLFLAFLILAMAGGGYFWYLLKQPYQGFQEAKILDFPHGTSTAEMAQLLQSAGVIKSARLFQLGRYLSPSAALQAGEYKFDKPESTLDVFRKIARGDTFYYELVVPEGNNLFDIAESIRALKIFPAERFLAEARNPKLIQDLDPSAPSLEGYLFPDTYRINRQTTAEGLCRTMTHRFREMWRKLDTKADVHQTVTLASMVEREARNPAERPVVASVFRNRLNIGMKLDCDPTTVYAALLNGNYRGKLYRSDLQSESPFNTYVHVGLPPGPIANPGFSSIKAALNPATTDYLFFVAKADGSGGHTFSSSLAQHTAAVSEYHRNLQK